MSMYFPNEGELEAMRSILATQQWYVGLYRNIITNDGSLNMLALTEMPTGGGRGYAGKLLTMDFAAALAADKWYLSMNSAGKAEGAYHNTYLEYEFNSVDVADGYTVYGVFAYTYVLPFDAGATEIKVGDLIRGATSNATGIVTGVVVTSGSWGAAAAGYLFVKTKTGTFQNDENLIIGGKAATLAITAGGTGYAEGDIVSITQTGGSGTKVCITEVAAGVVTSVALAEGGQGHSAAAGLPTANIVGTGTGLTLEIATLSTVAKAVSNTGTLYSGDAHKKLMWLEALTEAKLIETAGQKIRVTLKWTLSTA